MEQHTSPSHLDSQYYLHLLLLTKLESSNVLYDLIFMLLFIVYLRIICYVFLFLRHTRTIPMFVPEPTWRLQKFTRCDEQLRVCVFSPLSQQLWCCGWWVVPTGRSSRYLSVSKYLLLLCVCPCESYWWGYSLWASVVRILRISTYCLPAAVISLWKNTHRGIHSNSQHCRLLEMLRCTSGPFGFAVYSNISSIFFHTWYGKVS